MASRNDGPNSSGAVDLTGWTGAAGSSAVTPTRVTGLSGYDRTTGGRVTATAMQTLACGPAPTRADGIDLSGVTVSASVQGAVSAATSTAAQLQWLDSTGAVISSTTGTATSRSAGAVHRAYVSAAAPSGTRQVRVRLTTTGSIAVNSTLTVTAGRVALAVSDAALAYLDGDSTGGVWEGAAGASVSVIPDAITAWAADMTQANSNAAGFKDASYNRQTQAGSGASSGLAHPIATVAAPGRAGNALPFTLPTGGRRYEVEAAAQQFGGGETVFFGMAFYLPPGFLDSDGGGYRVIEQLRQSADAGSPPLAFEVLGSGANAALRVTGGYGINTATPAAYAYSQTLLTGLQAGRWYSLVHRVTRFSSVPGASTLDVWVDGTQVLTSFVIPPPTVIPYDTTYRATYRKDGLYRDPDAPSAGATPAATVYQTAHKMGTSYASVAPSLVGAGSSTSGTVATLAAPTLGAAAAAASVSGTRAEPAATGQTEVAAASCVSGTRAAATPVLVVQGGATSISGTRAEPAAAAATVSPGAATSITATSAAVAPSVIGAGAAVSGTRAETTPTAAGGTSASSTSGSVVVGGATVLPPLSATATSGTRAASAATLEAVAAAASVTGTRVAAGATRETFVSSAPAGANRCPNPSCAVDAAGHMAAGSAGTSGAQVTGLTGFDRPTGFRATNGSAAADLSAYGAAHIPSGGVTGPWTVTFQFRRPTAGNVYAYLVWTDATGALTAVSGGAATAVTAGQIVRVVVTGTAPAGAAGLRGAALSQGAPGGSTLDLVAVRIDQGSDPAMPYYDGDSPGWTWAGTPGASQSSGVGAAPAPSVTATRAETTGVRGQPGAGSAVSGTRGEAGMPALTASGAGAAVSGTRAGVDAEGVTRSVSGSRSETAAALGVLLLAGSVTGTRAAAAAPAATIAVTAAAVSATMATGAPPTVVAFAAPGTAVSGTRGELGAPVRGRPAEATAVTATVAATLARIGVPGAAVSVSGVVVVATASLPFRPVFRVPDGPPVPQVRTPAHRQLVVDTITGRVHWELPFSAFTWDSPLNEIGTSTIDVVVADALDAISDQVRGSDPRALLRAFLTGPYRWSTVTCYGTAAVWGGPLLPNEDTGGATVQVGAAQMERMLERRVLVDRRATATGAWTDPSRDLTLTGSTPAGAVMTIVAHAITSFPGGPNRYLPIVCRNPPRSVAGDENFTWKSFDLVKAWKALSDITGRDDGPDVRLEPVLTRGGDGAVYVVWDLQIGNPDLPTAGVPGPDGPVPYTWDDTTATVQRKPDPVGLASTYFSAGSGQDRNKQIVASSSTDLTKLGFPVLEEVDSNSSSDATLAALTRRNKGLMAAHSRPSDSWTLDVAVDGEPPLGVVRRGDLARIDTRRQLLIEPGTYTRRVTKVSGSAGPRMTLTCDEEDGLVGAR